MKLLLMLLACVQADKVVKPIRLPVINSIEPAPVVPPAPKPVTVLDQDHIFLVEADVQVIVIQSPDGMLQITEDKGPLRIVGKFAGSNKRESRMITSPWIYTIEGLKTGKAELILIPSGATSVTQVERITLSVNGAQPPPPDDDKEERDDDRDDDQPKPAEEIRIDIIEDVRNRDEGTASVLESLVTWEEFHNAGHQFRLFDFESVSGKILKQDYGSTQLPAMIIRDKKTSKVLRTLPMPKEWNSFKRIISEIAKI